jgi:uncharacterized protein (DUF3820 family)
MVDLVEAGGMTGTPEAIREFYELINCDPGEVRDIPPGRENCAVAKPSRNPSRKSGKPAKARQKRNAAAPEAVPLTAEERKVAEFDRKIVPWGRYKGQKWADVPVSFVQWFAGLESPKAPGALALQVAVREYLDLKYGLRPGRQF